MSQANVFDNSPEAAKNGADFADHVYGEGETTFTVDAETYRETRKAVISQATVANRWIAAEPGVSLAFGASKDDDGTPINSDCYTDGTAAHKALVAFLRELHPLDAKYEGQVLAYKGAKAGGADPTTLDDLETRRNLTANKIKSDTANGMRALKDAFIKNKQGEKGERTIKSPVDVLRECALKMGKFAEKSGTVQADKDLAAKYKQVLDGMLQSPDSLLAIWQAVPLAPVAGRITKDYTKPSEVKTLTADELAGMLADAVV
jgi:hypothetical protein